MFVSSTYTDLQDERQEVIQALLELECIPAGMELFPAADDDQWTLIKKVIDDCDYYIVIVGGRYGSLSATGLSYTQMEYEYAISAGKPVIGFIHKDPGSIPSNKTEQTEEGKRKLEEFRELVQKKMCKFWTTPSELGSMVSRSLVKLINSKPAIGWVKANLVPDESSSQEILKLRRRVEELSAELERARVEAPRGTEKLAQGEDKFKLNYSYSSFLYDSYPFGDLKQETDVTNHTGHFFPTWNEIFSYVSPYMIDEATESRLLEPLNVFIRTYVIDEVKKKHRNRNVGHFRINTDDFQTIKIQLRALGLITKSQKTRSVKDTATYWTLTPYGDNVMTQLRAIKKDLPSA